MRRDLRLGIAGVVALVACAAGLALGQTAPEPRAGDPAVPEPSAAPAPRPAPPVLRIGAMLPLTGPGAWFGIEIRRGLELAVAELDPRPRQTLSSTQENAPAEGEAGGTDGSDGASPTGPAEAPAAERPDGGSPGDEGRGDAGTDAPETGTPAPRSTRPPANPIEPADRPKDIQLALEVSAVEPLDVRAATAEFHRLVGGGALAVFTASPTPTLTAIPLAAARGVLVIHSGMPTDRFPVGSRTLLQLRPSIAARATALAGYAWARGIRRLAVVAAGDEFGRATRAAVAAHWRQRGATLVHEESFTLDDPELRSRLRRLARSGAQAVVVGFAGAAFGEAARAIRAAGYAGLLLAPDDDRLAMLSAGPALGEARFVSDAFLPVPETRGARFARAYEARHRSAPSRFAAAAYEAAVLLVDGARKALEKGPGLSGGRLRDALVAQGRWPSLYAGEVAVREDGTLARPLALLRAEDGRPVLDAYLAPDGRPVPTPHVRLPRAPALAFHR